mmetsp:Transcript_4696/g.15579  ORF Transcript_4696/g.15579 Transcript_4696/m.15579 type:complete len:225 (-) Transcript_4696:296-970(-)
MRAPGAPAVSSSERGAHSAVSSPVRERAHTAERARRPRPPSYAWGISAPPKTSMVRPSAAAAAAAPSGAGRGASGVRRRVQRQVPPEQSRAKASPWNPVDVSLSPPPYTTRVGPSRTAPQWKPMRSGAGPVVGCSRKAPAVASYTTTLSSERKECTTMVVSSRAQTTCRDTGPPGSVPTRRHRASPPRVSSAHASSRKVPPEPLAPGSQPPTTMISPPTAAAAA